MYKTPFLNVGIPVRHPGGPLGLTLTLTLTLTPGMADLRNGAVTNVGGCSPTPPPLFKSRELLYMRIRVLSVTHGHAASPPIGRYLSVLPGDRGSCVNDAPRVAARQRVVRERDLYDLLFAGPAPTSRRLTHYC